MAPLPPFANQVPILEKLTTDDTDDFVNMPHQHLGLNAHDEIHDLSMDNHTHENGVPLGGDYTEYGMGGL